MPNGTLRLYNKLTNALLVSLDILGTFNIEENLNETPSNMKVKVITSNTYREEFEVNTVAHHQDTNSWWVIKSDESTYMTTGEYEHEIQLVEYLEFYSYRHLPNCAFAPNTYTLEQMLNRLFDIAKLSITVNYPTFLDKDKIMPFFSFENFTVANAIKNIARAINAIPKMSITFSGFSLVRTLTFINRNGIDTEIKNLLDTQFPIAYEKNMNSSDQFTTRSVSNITNAKSGVLTIAPKNGGFKNVSANSSEYTPNNSKVFLPSKIEKIDFISIFTEIIIFSARGSTLAELYRGYWFDSNQIKSRLVANAGLTQYFTADDMNAINLISAKDLQTIYYNDTINPSSFTNTFFRGLYSLKNKFDYDTSEALSGNYNTTEKVKNQTFHWSPFTNELIVAKPFRDGLASVISTEPQQYRASLILASKTVAGLTENIIVTPRLESSGVFSNKASTYKMLYQVGYYPIADIKVSIDNDNDAQDEKFFNQSGKVIDAVSVSKLITSHTNDSVEGTKVRNARYESPTHNFSNVLPLGQLVRDNNQIYVITQRSIDGQVKNENEYYNVIYTLSRNRVARSENLVADSSVISYKTPDDNLVFRSQLYKDYIELSLVNENQDEPYMPVSKVLVLSNTLAGTNFDFTVIAKNSFGTTPTVVRYVRNPITFDLHKSKLMNVNWQSNNVVGFRFDATGNTFVQTPIVYTDDVGKATNFELLFLDTSNILEARSDFNDVFSGKASNLIPFEDLTRVDSDYYETTVIGEEHFSMQIKEDTSGGKPYQKDPFEIPVFEYMIQGNDSYTSIGNTVIGNDLFSTFTDANIRYFYVLMGGDTGRPNTRFTAENAVKLIQDYAPTTLDQNRVTIIRNTAIPYILNFDLFSDLATETRNNTNFTNIGIFAVIGTTNAKFLFAINDYVVSGINDNSNIRVFINNWKI